MHEISGKGTKTSHFKTYMAKKCPLMLTKEFVDMDVVESRRQAEGKGAGFSRGIALPEISKIMVLACGYPAYSQKTRLSLTFMHFLVIQTAVIFSARGG